MDDMSANPAAGSDSDPVSMIEGILEREQAPTEKPRDQRRAQGPDAEPEPEIEEIPDPEPGPEEPPTEEDGEEDGDATEEPEQQEPVSETYTVKIDGKDVAVTKEELLAGYQREADYRRKTQEIAANRQQVEAEAQRIQAERQHYAEQLAQVEVVLRSQLPVRPTQEDYDADPIGAVQAERRWMDSMGRLQALAEERKILAEQQAEHAQRAHQQMLAHARERLAELVPEWRKPEVAAKEKPAVANHLREIGYTDAEIGQAADPRALVLARESMLYRQLMASKPQVAQRVAQAPKMVRPGTSGAAPDRTKAIVQKIKRSGGKDIDAVAAFLLT